MLSVIIVVAATVVAVPLSETIPGHPCSAAEYHQFDFWVGNWTVTDTATHKVVGHNAVTKIAGGCGLQEHWKGADGAVGTSLNSYFAGDHEWHQTWVGGEGLLLRLDGRFVDGRMILAGKRVTRDGKTVTDRIAWTPGKNGQVRQVWDYSLDGGKTWTNSFDGTYRR